MKASIKWFVWLVVFTGTIWCLAQSTAPKRQWNATVMVVDETGQPVPGAHVQMSWYVNAADGSPTYDKVEGPTDNMGIFKAVHNANGSIDLGFVAAKGGYYTTTRGYELAPKNDSDPKKWNPTVTLLLKNKVRPTPMYAKQEISLRVPELNKAIGYDLTAGDWVVPYGKGVKTDLFFTENHTNANYILTVSFPNQGDGIQEFSVPYLLQNAPTGQSDLRSSQEAPESGYQPTFVQMNQDQDRNFYFRARTIRDEKGNIKSALYGKIYGDFMQFTYYLNPTPNDRNIEFDPAHNLLAGQRVNQP